MKPSEKIAGVSVVVGAVVAGVVWYFDQSLPWWGYMIIGLIAAGFVSGSLSKSAARKAIIDREQG